MTDFTHLRDPSTDETAADAVWEAWLSATEAPAQRQAQLDADMGRPRQRLRRWAEAATGGRHQP